MASREARGEVAYWETNNLDEHVALIARQVHRSLDDPETRRLAVRLVSGRPDGEHKGRMFLDAWGKSYWMPQGEACEAQSDACESTLIWNFVVQNVRYVLDPDGYDLFSTLKHTLSAGGGDCFPAGTLLLRDDYSLAPIEHLRVGDRIWGGQEWTQVEGVGPKGPRSLTAIRLNNGSTVKLTEDHKVYVVTCPRHAARVQSPPCQCPTDQCHVERIRVADLEPGARLLQPTKIAFGADNGDPDRHYVEGLYAADGWSDQGSRFAIAGKDGHPKEAQKRKVEAICSKLGLATRNHERYIAVNDRAWTERMVLMGKGAPNKRLLSLDLGEAQATALLDGVMADSGANTNGTGRTFTTTSRTLATQVRVLNRMLGRSCGSAYIEAHGGLGTHPIYRMNVRGPGAQVEKILRVKDVVRDLPEEHVYDVQTYDHKVYLPEHDVTVSNCDDMVISMAALHRALGFRHLRARIVSTKGSSWEHVYLMVGFPKMAATPTRWVALDPTVKGATPGWEYPQSSHRVDYTL